ncbi:MAG: MraY family glycosyltransferase [Phycisphaerae bacterium]
MTWLCLSLVGFSLALAVPLTWLVRGLSARMAAFDTPPLPGQVKAPARAVPNTGGIAIFWAFCLPVVALLITVRAAPDQLATLVPAIKPHLQGLASQTPIAITLLAGMTLLHVLGLIDDRKPLGPWLKLTIMAAPAIAAATVGQTRLLTYLDEPGSFPLWSTTVTVLWFLVVTNAMNFIDNMDGLAGGCAATACSLFLVGTLAGGQWFIAACLALLLGALLGFLAFNRPPATIFMGDGGSLVIGFLLAFLTTRTTYVQPGVTSNWFAVLTPLVVLALPLYDFTSVTLIRLRAGKSPFVGDLNHLSHRLTRRGMSKAAAVGTICGLTAVTGVSGLLLRSADTAETILIALQVGTLLLVVACVEFATTPEPSP